ncbi:MarR family transcriptional regulator [Sphingomonadaceae bacterium G21617-S1]|nr:MarR family transcriptional regulator [Sphingomonadaceae bacterium G21617-S1]
MADLASAALAWTLSCPSYELTTRQIALLAIVCDSGMQHVRDLAGTLRVSKPVVTRAANTLETLKLVERVKHPDDKRFCLIAATGAGAELRARMRKLR